MALLRSVATVGGFTGISRVLGFLRDILIAQVVGAGPVADAFFVAFKLPNLFRRLFGEGAFNAAFVPLYARHLEDEGADKARLFAEETLAVLLTALLGLTALALVFMPWVMWALAPGFGADPDKFDLAVQLSRITFPYLIFMSLVALFSGILNALYRFAAAAAAPVLLNLILIAALLFVLPRVGQAGLVLSWAVTVSGVAQLVMVIWAARRAGVVLRVRWPRLTPGVKRLLRLMGPGAISAGALQFNLFVSTIIASLQAGAVSYLYYADRIYQLPLGLIGVAVGIALLPDLARKLRGHDPKAALTALNRGLELSMVLTLPAAAALIAVPMAVILTLFGRGAFSAGDADATAQALALFALGLPAYVLVKVFQPGFYAREDTMTPLKASLWGMGANVSLGVALFFVFGGAESGRGHLGLALATAIAAWLNALILGVGLYRRGFLVPDRRLYKRLGFALLAAAVMGGLVYWLNSLFSDLWQEGEAARFVGLGLLVLAGVVCYGGLALALGAARFSELRAAFAKRKAP